MLVRDLELDVDLDIDLTTRLYSTHTYMFAHRDLYIGSMMNTATNDPAAQGGHRHVAGQAADHQQHQRLLHDRRHDTHDAGSSRHGQARLQWHHDHDLERWSYDHEVA